MATTDPDPREDLLARLAPSGAENFITEAFCWLLSHAGFGDRFLGALEEVAGGDIPAIGRGCDWTTQRSYPVDGVERRPDMICVSSDGAKALIFEHKVWAELHEGQLDDYRSIGQERFEDYGLILVTARKSQYDQSVASKPPSDVRARPVCHLLWRTVYGWLSGWLDDGDADDVDTFVARSFLGLLERRGLGPMHGMTSEQLRAIPLARAGVSRIKALMEGVADHPFWWSFTEDRKVDDRWGRRGLYLRGTRDPQTWDPGLFVGVLHHADNHGPPSVNDQGSRGPVACLILDVHENWHDRFEHSEPYLKLVQALDGCWPGAATDDWRLHGSQRNPGQPARSGDRWHPLAVYKPLDAVVRGAQTGEDQVERFVQDVGPIAKTISDLEELRLFQQHLRSLGRRPAA